MERLNPTNFVRIGLLNKRIRILQPNFVMDPESGGWVPAASTLIAEVYAGIEPAMLSRLQKEEISGGAVINAESYHITFWYVPKVNVSHVIEYDYVEYPGPNQPVVTRLFEILEMRQVYEDYRFIELLCKERVPVSP